MKPDNVLQWNWFLEMTSSAGPFPQRTRKIDTKLSNALSFLHEQPVGSPFNILAFRNLVRGWRFGLPSGTSVPKKLCIQPIDIDPSHEALWFYLLKEAEDQGGERLGPVGSTIVCAVFAGLLKGDPNSFLNVEPCWTPDNDPLLRPEDKQDSNDWTLAAIIRLSGLPVSAEDVQAQTTMAE